MEDVKPWEWDWAVLVGAFAVLISFVSAMIALYASQRATKIAEKQLNIASELEISKLREKWIEQVREEMTEVIFLSSLPLSTYSFSNDELHDRYTRSITNLLLLLPHEEQLTLDFVDGLNVMKAAQNNKKCEGEMPANQISLGKKILKKEWDRLIASIDDIREKNAKN